MAKQQQNAADINPSLAVMALDTNNTAYLVKESSLTKDSLGLVTGVIHDGEQPSDAVKRELFRQLGIEAEIWISLGLVHQTVGFAYCPVYLFIARNLSFRGSDSIQAKAVKVPFRQALQMVLESEITHAPSCVVILKTAFKVGF